MKPQQEKGTYTLAVIVVGISLVASWQLLISPARSENSKLKDEVAKLETTVAPPRPVVSADADTIAAGEDSATPASSEEIKNAIQSSALLVKVTKLIPYQGGYKIEIEGTLPNISSFFNNFTSKVKMDIAAQIDATGPYISINKLVISTSPVTKAIATAEILPQPLVENKAPVQHAS